MLSTPDLIPEPEEHSHWKAVLHRIAERIVAPLDYAGDQHSRNDPRVLKKEDSSGGHMGE
jgi:hypothetical protein